MRWMPVMATLACAAPACADECDARAAMVARATGATIDHRSLNGDNVYLRHPITHDLSVECNSQSLYVVNLVSLSVRTSHPPAAFFELAGAAAKAALNLRSSTVEEAAIQCRDAALEAPDEHSEIALKQVLVECRASNRDGGETRVDILRNEDG